MNILDLKNDLIASAKKKLENHKTLGAKSNLSLVQVAELWDIVAGRGDQNQMHEPQFVGLHSLN